MATAARMGAAIIMGAAVFTTEADIKEGCWNGSSGESTSTKIGISKRLFKTSLAF